MLASYAGLLNLTVASVISLTGPSQEGVPFLSAHPNKLVLRETSAVGKLVAAHGYRQKRENKLEIKK